MPEPYIIIPCQSREDWLEKRKEGIGASEAASIMDESPWKSKIALWGEKTGQVEPDDLSDNEAVFWGTELEDKIIKVFGKRTGRYVEPSGELLRSIQYPWAQCTLDAQQAIRQQGTGLLGDRRSLEVKNTGAHMSDHWEEGPPRHYWWQCQHQMLVTGDPWMSIAALLGGQRLIWQDVERDEIAIRQLIHAGQKFWGMVESQTPPEPDGTESAKAALAKLYPEDSGELVNLSADLEEVDGRLLDLKTQKSLLEAQIRANENLIKAAIGDATHGVLPSGDSYSWKLQRKDEYVVKASEYRVFRRHKAKRRA